MMCKGERYGTLEASLAALLRKMKTEVEERNV